MTDAVERLVDKLVESLGSGNYLLAILIVAAGLLFNYKAIVEFIEERKRAKAAKISSALQCEFITGITKEHLEEQLAVEQFNLATGVRLEKEFREAVLAAHKRTNGEVSFAHFKRALPHIFYEGSALSVKITLFDWISFGFNYFFGFILLLFGIASLILPRWTGDVGLLQFLCVIGIGSIFIVTAFLMFTQTFPIYSARKVAKYC